MGRMYTGKYIKSDDPMEINEKLLYKILGGRIQAKRLSHKLSQGQLADSVGLQRTSITNIEAGTQKVQLHTLYEIASVLQCSIGDLIPDIETTEQDVALLVGEQKILDNSGKVGLRQDEQAVVLRMISEPSRKEGRHGKKE